MQLDNLVRLLHSNTAVVLLAFDRKWFRLFSYSHVKLASITCLMVQSVIILFRQLHNTMTVLEHRTRNSYFIVFIDSMAVT